MPTIATSSDPSTKISASSKNIPFIISALSVPVSPVINAPEVAILGVARLATRPVWNGSEFVPRQMLPLSLSYDHRAVNGAEGGRFIAYVAEILGDIRRLAL